MYLKRPSHPTVVAYVALFFAMGGTAVAATGSTFITGRGNSATTTTTLTNSGGIPLSLAARAGSAPLVVNSTVKVGRLNADLVDGLDSTNLQRRVSGSCPSGQVMIAVVASGGVTCTLLAPPPPAPAPAQFRDKGFAIADLQVTQDSLGEWDAVARITNETASVRSGSFTVTIFRNGSIVATLRGSVSGLSAGNANTVDFFSTDKYSPGDFTTNFQTDSAYAG